MEYSTVESSINESNGFKSYSALDQSIDQSSVYSDLSIGVKNESELNLFIHNEFLSITKSFLSDSKCLFLLNDFDIRLHDTMEFYYKNNSMGSSRLKKSKALRVLDEEVRTWKMIYALYNDRFNNINGYEEDSVDKPIYSEQEVLRGLFKRNKEIREAQLFLNTLEYFMSRALDNNHDLLLGTHGEAWKHTKYLMKSKGVYLSIGSRNQLELDPDAPLRGSLKLTDTDKNDEHEYFKCLFHCLRAGEMERGLGLCESHGELWRLLTLDGWRPLHNPLLQDGDKDIQHCDFEGNQHRQLFLDTCQSMSENTNLDMYERGIYSIYAGNLSVLVSLDRDWNSVLWSHFKVFVAEAIDHELETRTDNGQFGNQSVFGSEDDGDLALDWRSIGVEPTRRRPQLLDCSLTRLFEESSVVTGYRPEDWLQSSSNTDSLKFYRAVFHYVQKCLIIEDLDGLMAKLKSVVAVRLPDSGSEAHHHLLRFLAHLAIFLYSTHMDLDLSVYNALLEAYIAALIEMRRLENVTFYVAKLPTDIQVHWYCLCIRDVLDEQERRLCVLDAEEQKLPIVIITNRVTSAIRLRGHDSPLAIKLYRRLHSSAVENMGEQQCLVTEQDRMRIDGLVWLTFLPQQRAYLVRQVNALCRCFLQTEKLQAAKMAIGHISEAAWDQLTAGRDSPLQPAWLSSVLYENECIRKYIDCMDVYGDWFNQYHHMRIPALEHGLDSVDLSQISFHEKQALQSRYEQYQTSHDQWTQLVEFYAKKMLDGVLEMLKMGPQGWLSGSGEKRSWNMSHDEDEDEDNWKGDNDSYEARRRQIDGLRSSCISNVVFTLMQALSATENKPGLFRRAFLVSDLLADDEFRLAEVFTKKQLQKVFLQLRQCSMKLLSDGRDCVGFEV